MPDFVSGDRSSALAHKTRNDGNAEANDNAPSPEPQITDPIARFKALQTFYKQQLGSSNSTTGSQFPEFASPRSHISRIASLYSIGPSKKTSETHPQPMREALKPSEGLFTPEPPTATIAAMSQPTTYIDSATHAQQIFQNAGPFPGAPNSRFTSSLLPMPQLLRTKRSKRCGTCKHILVKHEYKPDSARYRIRLVALSYVPVVTMRPLKLPNNPLNTSISSTTTSGIPSDTAKQSHPVLLTPGQPIQYLLTLRNHIFERVRCTLGTPSVTPGKYPHRVTILCPQFEIGANAEMWEFDPPGESAQEVVAGKVFEKGRNWTGVVVEVVPTVTTAAMGGGGGGAGEGGREGEMDEDEDEDVLEIPVRVRLEWRQTDEAGLARARSREEDGGGGAGAGEGGGEGGGGGGGGGGEGVEDLLARELNYWMVLGVGRVQV
ncbi:MAG: hypothetical protein Q9227_001237 [Pyrenula ochraceoflavens]